MVLKSLRTEIRRPSESDAPAQVHRSTPANCAAAQQCDYETNDIWFESVTVIRRFGFAFTIRTLTAL